MNKSMNKSTAIGSNNLPATSMTFHAEEMTSLATATECERENLNLDSINDDMQSSQESIRIGGIEPHSINLNNTSLPLEPFTPTKKKKMMVKDHHTSSSDSYSPRRKQDASGMSFLVPRDCQVDLDKDQIYKIGKDIYKSVVRTIESSHIKKSKASVINSKI